MKLYVVMDEKRLVQAFRCIDDAKSFVEQLESRGFQNDYSIRAVDYFPLADGISKYPKDIGWRIPDYSSGD